MWADTRPEALSSITGEVGRSSRHLRARFGPQVGPAPKAVARVARLQRALRLRSLGLEGAEVAAFGGFHDQAHRIREFKAMTGLTPSRFAARRGGLPPGSALDRVPGRVTSLPLPTRPEPRFPQDRRRCLPPCCCTPGKDVDDVGRSTAMLSALGLDTSTEAVHMLLAARPEGWGVGQMAERLGLEEQHVRDALDRLAELSLLRRSADRPGGWRAIHPELGLQLLLRRQQDELGTRAPGSPRRSGNCSPCWPRGSPTRRPPGGWGCP
ncbi:helix-turn-helix domain-containing protein [Streptomyces sp. NPDC040724]|uniref:helix-turn-helix domain-containing protein n=1 Tax=Streptomyces sp. NPDC040724 TaxID=3155612 RepID=UPI0033F1F9C9